MNENEIKSFVFYQSYYKLLKELPTKQQSEILIAMCQYVFEGTKMELSGMSEAVFDFILPNLNANKKRYINGCKGGRPPKTEEEPNPETDETETEPNPEPNDNLNHNQNETEPITKTEPNPQPNPEPKAKPNYNNNNPTDYKGNDKDKGNGKEVVVEGGLRGEVADAPQPQPPAKRFVKPTLTEVKKYCIERSNGIDAEHFIDYYTANGWRVGRGTMVDWKAAVRTWERQAGKSGGRQKAKNQDDGVLDKWGKVYDLYGGG